MSAAVPTYPVRSMTGFAVAEGDLDRGGAFTVTIKGVNHRFLDLHLRLPVGSDALEQELRRAVKEKVARGHVEVILELLPAGAVEGVQLNQELLGTLLTQLQAIARQHELSTAFDPASLLRVPGVLLAESRAGKVPSQELLQIVPGVFERSLAAFQTAREIEGAELVREMRAGMARLRSHVAEIRVLRAGVRVAQFERLRDRLRELLGDTAVSEDRLLTEAALLADKSDIEEEAVRLETHIDRFLALLAGGGAVGKQLDFLLQEFNREANTVLSKSGSAAGPDSTRLVALGLEMKSEIERIREQVQNLE